MKFVKGLILPTERQVNRIINEFNIMTSDLNEPYMGFEYYQDKENNEWILNVIEIDKKRFDKRIDFILNTIKDNGGF